MATRTSQFYDLIVLGSDLAGLVAAAIASRRDQRVLIIPDADPTQSFSLPAERGSPAFTVSVETAPCLGLDGAPVRRAFEELGTWQQVRRSVKPLRGRLHYALPQHRLDLRADLENLSEELTREWPGDPVEDAWSRRMATSEGALEFAESLLASDPLIAADALWGHRFRARTEPLRPTPSRDDMAPLPAPHPLRRVAAATLPWLIDLDPAQLDWSVQERLVSRWFRGAADYRGGLAELRAHILQRFKSQAGDVKPNLRVAELHISRGKVTGLSLLGKRERYGCEHLLLACDPRALLLGAGGGASSRAGESGVLPTGALPEATLAALDAVTTVGYRYVLALALAPDGLSPALDGVVVHVPEDSDCFGASYLRLAPSKDPRALRLLTITHVLPAGAELERARERVLDGLDRAGVLPFVRPHVHAMLSPHDGLGVTDGLGRAHGRAPPPVGRWPMAPLYAHARADAPLGVGLLPHSSGLRNMYFASRMTLPGLGLEGQFAAGLTAASLVAPAPAQGKTRRLFRR
ncbi:MAG: hypothetical protein H6713_39915 [Myxococcales bacterium]|nr:hypothetical protein [Myxococcales bacterium]